MKIWCYNIVSKHQMHQKAVNCKWYMGAIVLGNMIALYQ